MRYKSTTSPDGIRAFPTHQSAGFKLTTDYPLVVVIDEEDKRVFEKRLNNDLSLTLKVLSRYRKTLQSVAVASTFNWYWLVDGLQEHGYNLQLVNTAAVRQYDGLKYSGDYRDAFSPRTPHAVEFSANGEDISIPKHNKRSEPVTAQTVTSQIDQRPTLLAY